MDLGHLNAALDWLAGAIEHAGGRVTERDLNYVEDSAELFYERPRALRDLPQEAAGYATWVAPWTSPTPEARTCATPGNAPHRQGG